MLVRKANSSDVEGIVNIHRTARERAMPWLPVLHTKVEDFKYFKTRVLPDQTVNVVIVDDKVVGFAACKDDWLNHLYIEPDYWRRGIGGMLISTAKASSDGLQLWTFQKNTMARQFYLANGFTEVELTDGQSCEEKMPDVRMMWNQVG